MRDVIRIVALAGVWLGGCASAVTPEWPATQPPSFEDVALPPDVASDASACPSDPNRVQTGFACGVSGERCRGYSPCALTWVDCMCDGTAWDCGRCAVGGDASSDADANACPPEGSIVPGSMCTPEALHCLAGMACGTPGVPVFCDCTSGSWRCEIVDCLPPDAGSNDASDGAVCPTNFAPGSPCTNEGARCNTTCLGWPDTPCNCTSGVWQCFCEG